MCKVRKATLQGTLHKLFPLVFHLFLSRSLGRPLSFGSDKQAPYYCPFTQTTWPWKWPGLGTSLQRARASLCGYWKQLLDGEDFCPYLLELEPLRCQSQRVLNGSLLSLKQTKEKNSVGRVCSKSQGRNLGNWEAQGNAKFELLGVLPELFQLRPLYWSLLSLC